MTAILFKSATLAPQQWERLAKLVSAYRFKHSPLTQEQFAERLTEAVQEAARQAGIAAAGSSTQRYTKQDISRIEAWARPEQRRPHRLPRIVETFQLQGLAAVLGMRVPDMIGLPGNGSMQRYEVDASPAQVAVLGETLRKHEPAADGAVVWADHVLTMFFPTNALYAYYQANYLESALAENWVSATEERREAVLERAAQRRWWFTHVLFASDLLSIVNGSERFASIDRELRASCLEGLLRAIADTPNCEIAVIDDASPDLPNFSSVAALKIDVGAYTHVSNMGNGCVVLQDLLGVWHVGEQRSDVRAYRSLLGDLVDIARYRDRAELAPYLESLIQETLKSHA